MSPGFRPPPYPYDRLAMFTPLAEAHEGGLVDLSVGTPTDPPPPAVVEALGRSGAERGYPPSVGTSRFRQAASGWLRRRLGVAVEAANVAACVGTKELVAGLPQWLRLRTPERDTVLYPALSYPTYAMGATLAGCRAVAVDVDEHWRIDVGSIDEADAARALCLWVNTPGNPAGGVDDLGAAAAWGRDRGVPVLSDECYVELTWGERHTILEHGPEGVLALHSVSKRSNMAGCRAGFYAGDRDLVHYLSEVRKHAGFMVPGPVQEAAAVALDDDAHVEVQRKRYRERLELLAELLRADPPAGGLYVWAPAPGGDAWAFVEDLARHGGCLVAPGDLYGQAGGGHVRVAAVQPMHRLQLVAERLARSQLCL